MKKIFALLLVGVFVLGSLPLVLADGDGTWDYYSEHSYRGSQPYQEGMWKNYTTSVTIQGGGASDPAIVKAKWETPDDDLTVPLSQVTPDPGQNKMVTYHAVVKKGTGDIDSTWAEVYHPDGTYKYEVLLGEIEDEYQAASIWTQITDTNIDAVTFNMPYYEALFGMDVTMEEMILDVLNELLQFDKLYIGSANLSYCQPAGWYTVAAIAHDNAYGWCTPLWNHFWYVPFAAFETDFTSVDWGTIQSGVTEWVAGDYSMSTPTQPTIRNIGNCPINFNITNDDMGFGWDTLLEHWNVYFDVRLGHIVDPDDYEPMSDGVHPGDEGTDIPGGPIPLCTEEKIDFSIHIRKPTESYGTGFMTLTAYIDPDPFTDDYWTPESFRGDEPGFMDDLTIPSLTPDPYGQPSPLPSWTDFP